MLPGLPNLPPLPGLLSRPSSTRSFPLFSDNAPSLSSTLSN